MELDADDGRKRKRTSSSSCTLTSQHVRENLHRYGETILQCAANITRGIKDAGNNNVLKYICALLNSGGGILHMRNIDAQRGVVLSKHLDTWWSGMEIKMAEILSRDDICNYFDLVGNHDDPDLYLFVKTAEHLCSLRYHSRLPTDTATHEVTYQSMLHILVTHGEPSSLEELPPIPDRFVFGRSAYDLKKETKQIQFKQLSGPQNRSKDGQTLPEKIRSNMIKYVSAFANHEGGHIYFGIDDARASVYGEELSQSEQKITEWMVDSRMKTMIWRNSSMAPIRGVHWDIRFYPVEHLPRKNMHRVIVVVSVCKFPGGVFTNCPDSMYVGEDGRVTEFQFDRWREAVLNPLRDVPELHHRFIKLSLMVPRAPLIFSLPNTIDSIIQKVFLAKADEIQPRRYIESYANLNTRQILKECINSFKGNNCICMGMECWGLKIPMMQSNDVICDVMVISESDGVHVLTFSTSVSESIQQHAQGVAACLKHIVVQNGGCIEKFSVMSHVIDIQQRENFRLETEPANRDIYPSHFSSTSRKFNKVLRSVVIAMAAYRARSQNSPMLNEHGSYNFLLTHDQFELLWTQQFTRALWVHGPAGAGKTVAAIQMIQELRRRGCAYDNVLYLAENDMLADFVRSHNLCLVTTRRALLVDEDNTDLMINKYGAVCNVIVDECQNFKDRDGDWYSLAEKLANQKAPDNLHQCCNYFWLFMDYSQKVHKFQAGLPSVIGKNNFMLSEVSRSTKEIFEFTSRLMMASESVDEQCNPLFPHVPSVPKLGHNFSSGKGVDILTCKEDEIRSLLTKVMSGLLKNGVHENDIAILVGKRKDLTTLQPSLQPALKEVHGSQAAIEGQDDDREARLPTSSSVEEHLKFCQSDLIRSEEATPTQMADEQSVPDDDSSEEEERVEISNPFQVLSDDVSDPVTDASDSVSMETEGNPPSREKVTFYGQCSLDDASDVGSVRSDILTGCKSGTDAENNNDEVAMESAVAIDTVRRFSGLDKSAVIGINPHVNEDHADFKKFILSLATRARDNLVIITTSDNVKQQLEKYVTDCG